MARTAPLTLPADTGITTAIWNNQIAENLQFLLGLKMNGTTLTSFADGANLDFKAARFVSGASLAGASPVTIDGIPTSTMALSHLRFIAYYRTTDASERMTSLYVGGGSIGLTNFARSSIALVGNTVTGASDNNVTNTALLNCSAGLSGGGSRFSLLDVNLYDVPTNDGYKILTYVHRASIGTGTNDQKLTYGGCMWLSSSAISTLRIGLDAGDFASGSKYWLYGWSNYS